MVGKLPVTGSTKHIFDREKLQRIVYTLYNVKIWEEFCELCLEMIVCDLNKKKEIKDISSEKKSLFLYIKVDFFV